MITRMPELTASEPTARDAPPEVRPPFPATGSEPVIRIRPSTGWAPLVEAGRLRLLVTWGAQRTKRFPEVPTLREVGIDIVSASPYGFAGPKGMDPGVVKILHDAFKAALFDPAHLAVLERYDMEPAYMNSEDYASFARRLYQDEGEMVRRLGLRVN